MYMVITMNIDRPDGVKIGASFVEKIKDGINLLSFINKITRGRPADIFTFDKKSEAESFAEFERRRFKQCGKYEIVEENKMYTVSEHNPA